MTPEEKKEWYDWFNSRPKEIQELVKKYPPGTYKIKPGAPYAISCPGTIVQLYAYIENSEDGEENEVSVIIFPSELLVEAKKHIKYLCQKHGTNYTNNINTPTKTNVETQYLELIEIDKHLKNE